MTYEQYWYGDTSMVKAYREADKIRQERMNEEAWLRGMYIYDAIARLSPILVGFVDKSTKNRPYVEQPYQFSRKQAEEEKTEQQEENEMLMAKLWMHQFVEAGKNWGKGG